MFKRLPTRIVFFVFAVTLITSLTVTFVSVNSTREFLREKINQEVPAALKAAAEGIDVWYGQRLAEMGVFSDSEVMRGALRSAVTQTESAEAERAQHEVKQYLGYLLDAFPHYTSLFVLGEEPGTGIIVGPIPDLDDDRANELRATVEAHVAPAALRNGQMLQLASAPILNTDGQRIGSLHAVLRTDFLNPLLGPGEIGHAAVLSLVDSEGVILASTRSERVGDRFDGELPRIARSDQVVFEDYEDTGGDVWVGGMTPFGRFGWWLIYEKPYEEAFAPVVSTIGRITLINLAIVLVMGLAAFQIAVSIVRPIEAVSSAARRIGEGEPDVEIPEVGGSDEVAVLSRVLRDMTEKLTRNSAELERSHHTIENANASLQHKNEELQEMNDVLEQLSITDGLTKLHNHRYFQEALVNECKRADRTHKPLALILIDIDEFKKWNDRLGHAGGDEILRKMAAVLNEGIRETDQLARYGGEEFALIATNTQLLGAAMVAEKLREQIATTQFFLEPPSERSQVTVSMGVALYRGDRKALFNEADRALYRAKGAGRDCVMICDDDDDDMESAPI